MSNHVVYMNEDGEVEYQFDPVVRDSGILKTARKNAISHASDILQELMENDEI